MRIAKTLNYKRCLVCGLIIKDSLCIDLKYFKSEKPTKTGIEVYFIDFAFKLRPSLKLNRITSGRGVPIHIGCLSKLEQDCNIFLNSKEYKNAIPKLVAESL